MPDKKLTDAEIVKALEQCSDCNAELRNSCNGCLLLNYFPYCTENGIDLGVDLINRLQAENERLKGIKTNDWLIKGISTKQLQKEKIQVLTKEIKRLLGKIEDLEANRVKLLENIEQLESVITQIKAEAYKEFADMLNRAFALCHGLTVFDVGTASRVTDNLLKELVGDSDGT